MKTTVKELKAYYVERGGSAATVANITTIPDMIAAITQLEHTSPAVELPKVTSTDNGDVLTVVEGKWEKAVPGGGGGSVLIVEGTWDNSILTLNKTWKEIHDGLLAGSVVLYKEEPHEGYIITSGVFYCSQVYNEGSTYAVYFGNSKSFTTSSETGYPSYDYDS